MKPDIYTIAILLFLSFSSCSDKFSSDASGSFEAEEILVSSEMNGKIISLDVTEGQVLEQNVLVGQIDVSNDKLKAEQVEASIRALGQKTNDPSAQVQLVQSQLNVQQAQLNQLHKERTRISNLLRADAATRKQLDDINASIDQLQKQILVTRQQLNTNLSNIHTQNRSILSEQHPLERSVAQIRNQISKGQVLSPIQGTVLSKFAYAGEVTTTGKALFKMANLDTMILKAYVSGAQLPLIKLGQEVEVLTDDGKKGFRTYRGRVSWISSKSEFTPKTIQTKDERANLVYAVKIRVANDGFLKIGMYGEVKFAAPAK